MDNAGPELNVSLWLCNMNKKMTIILLKKRKEQGIQSIQTLELEKAHFTGEFVIRAKVGGHVLRHLVSTLSNVIRQEGRHKF